MKILFWIPPWIAHGDPLFYRNCLRKHLLPQANLLAAAGCAVDLVLPEFLASERSLADGRVSLLELTAEQSFLWTGTTADPSVRLYTESDIALIERIEAGLRPLLSAQYDAILLWETPVPFLERMYPDALIVHQMPGVFSRAPFPHTVTFDTKGLYKRGTLFRDGPQIVARAPATATESLVRAFVGEARSAISQLQPFTRQMLDANGRFAKLALLPLQVSAHYSFQADTPYRTQADFLLHMLSQVSPDTGVVVTQYVTPQVQDAVLNNDLVAALQKKWPNLIFKPEFDRISGVSQYLTQLVDEVWTCSSSIGLQAMIWGRGMHVPQPTFLAPYATVGLGLSGEKLDEIQRNTLGSVLGHHQPLAKLLIEDGAFLLALLEELYARKKAGAKGIDAMPAFESLRPGYAEQLLQSFTIDRAAKDLGQVSDLWNARQAETGKFRRLLEDSTLKAVSFDVFDTLIKRPTEVPADVYAFLEQEAQALTGGMAEDFARVRLNAEVKTREVSLRGEITLEQIYVAVCEHFRFDEPTSQRLMQMEIDTEIRLIQTRNEGRKLWDHARSSGLPIYVISDMYLPHEAVAAMLAKAGYTGHKKLFVSSTYGVRKKEGDLFDVVLAELNLQPESMLHVGDNKVADVEQPQLRGMKAYRIPRAVDRMRGNTAYKDIYPAKTGGGEKARTVLAGLTAHALFDASSGALEKQSHFQGSAFNLGYAGVGPIVAGYMLWLGRQARRDGISRLYFLSREGWLLKQVYDSLHRHRKDAVPSTYLYASRRATRVASLRTLGDVLALAGQPYRDGVELGVLLNNRFGLMLDESVCSVIRAAGYSDEGDVLSSLQSERLRFSGLCASLSTSILEHAAEERSVYLEYLDEVGIRGEVRPAVVDLGWKANMQGALGLLLGKPLDGYYYATLQGAEAWVGRGHRLWAYAGDLVAAHFPSAVVANRHLMEFLTCHVEPSLMRMQRTPRGLQPWFRAEEEIGRRRQLIEEVHQGAVRLADDMQSEYGDWLADVWIDAFLAERTFASFVTRPHKVDAALLVGQHFEDALGGVGKQYIISPKAGGVTTDSVWRKGADAIYPPSNAVTTVVNNAQQPTAGAIPQPPSSSEEFSSAHETPAWLRRIEASVVRRITTRRKFEKYVRNREDFFADSKSPMAKTWQRFMV